MADDATLRCLNEACRRAFPRPVAFCPFCGRAQRSAPAPAAVPPVPVSPVSPPAASRPPPAAPPVAAAPTGTAPVFPAPPGAASRSKFKFSFGRKPMRIPELAPEFAYRPPSPPAPGPGARPGPRPIRKRTWLMVAMALAAVWLFAKPRPPETEFVAQADEAIALIDDCKLDPAHTALAALRAAKAPPAQLARVQNALREGAIVCQKKRARAKVEAAHAASLLDEADACLARKDRVCLENRLNAADKLQRPELAQRAAALRESLSTLLETTLLEASPGPGTLVAAPPAPPERLPPIAAVPAPQDQQVRAILNAAHYDMAQSNYGAAAERLAACAAVFETAGNTECRSLKQQAERLNTEMLRCLANNRTWMDGRCL